MHPVVFGTAGHIDHGKTALVAALTGVDCDRLPEEKRRGITLVLGFAPMQDPAGELEISFIDVPGHERLVHTMIAGAGAIDRALLVVAANEGVMPQTREHLDILQLLGVRGGVVALNKADLLSEDELELRRLELRGALAGSALVGAPIVPCSALSGAGVAELRGALLGCARAVLREEEPGRPFRLSADRVFSVPGAGTVVTGTARWGQTREGDELIAMPSGVRVRVRGVQVHGSTRQEGRAGERVALRVAGARVAEIARGEQFLTPGPWVATTRAAVAVRLLPSAAQLSEGDPLWVHLLAARVPARIERLVPDRLEPGGQGRVIVRLARPTFTVPGDHVVLRRISPAATLGGGRVLDAQPPRLRRREAARLADLPEPWRELPSALARWITEAGVPGLDLPSLTSRAGLSAELLEAPLGRLVSEGGLVATAGHPPTFVDPRHLEAVREAARRALASAGAVGLPLAELAARALPRAAARLRGFYLEDLRRSGVLREVAGRAVAGGASPVEDETTARLEALYREAGIAGPSLEDAAARLGAKPNVVAGLARFLLDGGRLVRVGGKWILHRRVLDEIADSLRSWGVETFDVGQFKDRFGLTRKLAIPILEWLDSARITRREGERRRLLPPRGGTRSGAGPGASPTPER